MSEPGDEKNILKISNYQIWLFLGEHDVEEDEAPFILVVPPGGQVVVGVPAQSAAVRTKVTEKKIMNV